MDRTLNLFHDEKTDCKNKRKREDETDSQIGTDRFGFIFTQFYGTAYNGFKRFCKLSSRSNKTA